MQKIVIDNITNEVLQIINLDFDSRFKEEWYPDCYIIDDVNNEITSHGMRYNRETEEFEVIEDYKEFETIIEGSEEQKRIAELESRLEMTQMALDELLLNILDI